MKKILMSIAVLACFAMATADIDPASYEYRDIVSKITKVSPPVVTGRRIVFTQSERFSHAGIVFDFENYAVVHRFMRVPGDREGSNDHVLFYILDVPENVSRITYRVELDGLWTIDPTNPENHYDHMLGFSVSTLSVPYHSQPKTTVTNGTVHFYFASESGQTVTVAGTFNNWDPFMYPMVERSAGEYYLDLPLPEGTWIYAFFSGAAQYYDKTNGSVVFSADGKKASKLTVE